MITFSEVAIIIVLFVLLLMALAKEPICFSFLESKKEEFDTYYDHDMRAHTVHQGGRFGGSLETTISDSDLKKRYNWSHRDKAGLDIFDDVYEGLVHEKNAGFKREYDYQETTEEPYDEKFNNVPNDRGYDPHFMWEGIEERSYYHPSLHSTKIENTDVGKYVEGGLNDNPGDVPLPGYTISLSQKGKH